MSQSKVAVRGKGTRREKAVLLLGSAVIVALYGLSAIFTYLVNAGA